MKSLELVTTSGTGRAKITSLPDLFPALWLLQAVGGFVVEDDGSSASHGIGVTGP